MTLSASFLQFCIICKVILLFAIVFSSTLTRDFFSFKMNVNGASEKGKMSLKGDIKNRKRKSKKNKKVTTDKEDLQGVNVQTEEETAKASTRRLQRYDNTRIPISRPIMDSQ